MSNENIINLDIYKPTHHPFKEVFVRNGIKTGTIANYLDLSYTYINNILNGHFKMPEKMYEKLLKLVKQLDSVEDK
jgi:hypothetical protein